MQNAKKLLNPFQLIILTCALAMGTFIQILDTAIANVSIPNIAGDLGVAASEGTWIITSFAVSNAIILPLAGFLAHRYLDVNVFVWSIFLFSIASLACGLAWSLPSLIFFRVLQGAAGGALIPLSQTLLLKNYPSNKKGLALGIWSTVVIVAPTVGPILGGWITENYGWRWIFYINIPIGFLSAYLTYIMIGDEKHKTEKVPLDFVGLGLLVIAISSLQILLDKGESLDWFSSPVIMILGFISFVAFYFFIPWNLLSQHPVVDFSCFKYKSFTISTILSAFGFMLFFGSVVLMPLWLQTKQGYTPFLAGVVVASIGIVPIFFSIFVGKYISHIGTRLAVTFSFLIFSYTSFLYSEFNTNVSFYQIILPRFIQGIAVTCYFIPLIAIALYPIPHEKLASASGIFHFIRLIAGGGIGTSLFVNLWSRWQQYYHTRLSENITFYSQATQNFFNDLKNLDLTGDKALKILDNTISTQASMLSFNDVFYLTGWIYLLLVPIIWFCNEPEKTDELEEPILSE